MKKYHSISDEILKNTKKLIPEFLYLSSTFNDPVLKQETELKSIRALH